MKHVKNGCLSDKEGIRLQTHHQDGNIRSCSGSPGLEILNIELQNGTLRFQSIIYIWAEHMFWNGICASNERHKIWWCGAENFLQPAWRVSLTNSLFKDNGYKMMIKDVSMPVYTPSGEVLGFDFRFDEADDTSGRNDAANLDVLDAGDDHDYLV
eukprot:4001487-Ditylum_brightwellii.AAC.1